MRTLWLLFIALLVLALPVAAQSDLTYGATVTGQTNTQYQFTGSAGDLVVAEAVGISPDFVPVLTLLDPSQLQAGQAHTDPLTPGATMLSSRLPANGMYTLLVSSLDGAPGQFVLTLNGSPISSAVTLAVGQTGIKLDTIAQVYQFSGPAEIDLSADQFAFSAEILDQDGQIVAELHDIPRATFAIDSGGRFRLTLQAGASGTVDVTYTVRADLLPTSQEVPPATTPVATEAALAAVTDTPVETETLVATSGLVATETSVPTATDTPIPLDTLAPTATTTNTALPTSTVQPTVVPTQPTATPSPVPQVKIAPPDSDYSFAIPLDGEIILSDFVSYPNGDRQDTVQFAVTGLNQNQSVSTGKGQLQIKASCAGKGDDSITFITGGKTYHCGDTVVNSNVTYSSRTGTIQITATGGDGTYVQWMLTGSATHTS